MTDPLNRRSIRWKGCDYFQRGAYHRTICNQDRSYWFGRMVEAELQSSPIGMLAKPCWDAIPQHMPPMDIGEPDGR